MKNYNYEPKTITQLEDLNLLNEYGFNFQRNLANYFHEIAEELRKPNNETK